MHWLQSLDTELFYFINRTLTNPFFDWLMPVLSGSNGVKGVFMALAIVAGAVIFCRGNARARLCVLLLLVVVGTNDGLICNTIKHAVARPRPFVTLPEARLFGEVGKGYVPPAINAEGVDMAANKGNRNGMPSSHAANWFAATMVLFLYYRRTLWFMLPMAVGVAFSRVYCGVHYPSDVLAGAILGAGYAVAFVVALDAIWQWLGKKWFPLWHAQLPSLLKPELKNRVPSSQLPAPCSQPEWLRLGYVLIFLMLIGHWAYIASGIIGLSKDEAYQWLWSKHLALSYYSKPPGIAFIQYAGTHLWGDNDFGVRFFSPLFAAILSVLVLRFFARELSARTGFWLLLAVNATPLLGLGTILMTIDPPLVLFWMWAMVAGWQAVKPDGRTRDWIVVGVTLGLGFLCKYTAAYQVICWAIFFALWPPARIHLRKPGPWLALLILLASTTPVIIWNAQHHWVTVEHVAGNAGLNSHWSAKRALQHFTEFVGAELILLNPVFFIGAIWATFGFWKFRHDRPLWLYFFCMGAPVFFGHLFYSFYSRILPNWIAPAIPPMFCLMAVYWHERFRTGSRWIKPFFISGLVFGTVVLAIMHQSNFIGALTGQLLPGEMDFSRRVRVWSETGAVAEAARKKLEAEGKPAFIIADHYGMTGLFTLYSPEAKAALDHQPLVYCITSKEPNNQLYFWPEYDYRTSRQGQNAIYITELNPYKLESGWVWKWLKHEPVNYAEIPEPMKQAPWTIREQFETITDLGEQEILVGSRVFRRVHLWACYNLK